MISTIAALPDRKRLSTRHSLMLFFAIAYLSQGISCAQFGVIAQPIQYFMMKGLKLTAADISSYLAIMMIPWVIKPLYGLISDFIPLFGYRRKSYLILANFIAAIAFVVMLLTDSLPVILCALFLTAIAMAIATALMVGLAVEQGRTDGNARDYFCIQEICYYIANMSAALAGGLLCHFLSPQLAFHSAAAIAMLPLLAVSFLTALLLSETKTRLDTSKLGETWNSLVQAMHSRSLWFAGIFSFCWSCIPSMGVPLYFFESKSLCFSQAAIGQLSACNAIGMLATASLYPKLTRNMSVKTQLQLAAALILISTLSYLALSDYFSAVMLELFRGAANMAVILSLYILAAAACPARTEVSVMAILVASRNVGTDAATFIGGQLFTHALHGNFPLLVCMAALAPALSMFLLPLLPAHHAVSDKHH